MLLCTYAEVAFGIPNPSSSNMLISVLLFLFFFLRLGAIVTYNIGTEGWGTGPYDH